MTARIPLIEDHRPIQQGVDGYRLGRAVVRRRVGTDKNELLVSEGLDGDARLFGLILEHGEVELSRLELFDKVWLIARIQMHAGVRICLHVGCDQMRQERDAIVHGHAYVKCRLEALVNGGQLRGQDAFEAAVLRAKLITSSPAFVGVMPVEVRSKSLRPTRFSKLVILWDKPGRDMNS